MKKILVILTTVLLASCTKDAETELSYTICSSDKTTQESLKPLINNLSPIEVQDSISMIVKAEKETLCQSLDQACTTLQERDELANWAVVVYPSTFNGEMEDQEPTFEWVNGSDSYSTYEMRYNYQDVVTFMNHTVSMYSVELYPIVISDKDGMISAYDMAPERVRAIYTTSNWPLNVGDARLFERGCQSSGNLNDGCGWKSKNVYLGALTKNDRRRRNCSPLNDVGDITGLKLMVTDMENYPETIQKDGITWRICPSYEGDKDLNKWAWGSYLYLYYTTDFTGMKFYIAPAKALEYPKGDDFHRSVYGGLCTWITDIAVKTEDFYRADGLNINSDNVYFIPLVNKNFDPDCSEYPANFNHNTKGNNVYISLPYVKVSK